MDWWQDFIFVDLSAATLAALHAFFKGWSSILLLILFWKFLRIVNSATNDLDWSDVISSRGVDGKQHLDISKVGLCVMVIQAIWLPAIYAYSSKLDGMGLAAVIAASASTLGSVAWGLAYLRAKQGIVETLHTEKTAIGEVSDKTTTVAPAPVRDDHEHS